MIRPRFAATLGLALLFVSALRADEKKTRQRPDRPGPEGPPIGIFPGAPVMPLLTDEEMEKLELSAEQKEKVAGLVKEFGKKQQAVMDDVRAAIRKAREQGDPGAGREIAPRLRELNQAQAKAREEAEKKLQEVLSDEQQKKFEELKKDRPARPGFPGIGPRPGPFAPFAPGQVLSPGVQDVLELSKEQKAELEKLQKEVDAKLDKLLNDEQRKKLKEMRERLRPPFRPLPPPPTPGRPDGPGK